MATKQCDSLVRTGRTRPVVPDHLVSPDGSRSPTVLTAPAHVLCLLEALGYYLKGSALSTEKEKEKKTFLSQVERVSGSCLRQQQRDSPGLQSPRRDADQGGFPAPARPLFAQCWSPGPEGTSEKGVRVAVLTLSKEAALWEGGGVRPTSVLTTLVPTPCWAPDPSAHGEGPATRGAFKGKSCSNEGAEKTSLKSVYVFLRLFKAWAPTPSGPGYVM